MTRWLTILVAMAVLSFGAGPAAAAGGEKSSGGSIFVKVRPVTVAVLNDGGLAGKVSAVFVLQAHDAQAEADINAAQLQLRNAYLQAMHRMAEEEARTGRLISLRKIKARLQRASDSVLGKGRVDEVLIQTFVRKAERQ